MMMNSNHSLPYKLPSESRFGYLFSTILIVASAYSLYKGNSHIATVVLFLLGCIMLSVSIIRPVLLAPFNKAWFLLGMLLGKIVSPIVLGAIFFLMITPIALLMRMNGRDVFALRRKKDVATYWIERAVAEPSASSFKNQF